MGKYCVRYKGFKVKGKPPVSKADMMMDAEDMADEGIDEEQEPQPKGKKAPPFQPEKQIVANVLGKSKKERRR